MQQHCNTYPTFLILTAVAFDNINNTLLKSIANEIINCITLIINQSISTGSYPENLKVAKVIAIFKKNHK